jgi:N-acetylglucosamine malate deacetylase 1
LSATLNHSDILLKKPMNPYATFVQEQSRLLAQGRSLPLGTSLPPINTVPTPTDGAPSILIFSPHPDDECIIGGLPRRLQREVGWRVVNVGVTLGSKPSRQHERLTELRAACAHLGFELDVPGERGLEGVNPTVRSKDTTAWNAKVAAIAEVIVRHQPRAILFPHEQDWNGTHIGVHHLIMDTLRTLDGSQSMYLVETEFWGQNYSPNLLVEIGSEDLADLIAALTLHVGEVCRNPYHLTLPAWMINNVRLGGETVGGQGAAPPDFPYGTVYRLRLWKDGKVQEVLKGGRILTCSDSVDALFPKP